MADNYRAMPEERPHQQTAQQQFAGYKTSLDRGLDVVINKVDIIKDKAQTVAATIDEQDAILDTVGNKLDRNNNQLKTMNQKMEEFLQSTSNNSIAGFIFLLLVAI